MPTINDALSYYPLKWSIIPTKRDKRPLIPWSKYQKEIPSEDTLKKWWADYQDANMAVVTGRVSGIVVIDIDGPLGEVAYKSLFGEIHKTVRQKTGKEGAYHLVFRYPKDGSGKLGNSARQAEEIDCRGDGGYILIAPSIHPSGRIYEWVIDPRDSPDDLMDLPPDVRTYFWPSDTSKPAEKVPLDVQGLLMGVEEGKRDDACTRLAGHYLRVFAGDMRQTEQVLELWNTRNSPPLDWKTVKKCVASIAKKQGKTEAGESIGAFIRDLEKHVYPDGSYKYVVYPQGRDSFFTVSSKDLADQSGFILRYMEAMDKKLPRIKAKDWDALLNKLLAEVKTVEISEDETDIGTIKDTLRNELRRPIEDFTMLENRIIINNGMIFFRTKTLLDRVKYQENKIDLKALGGLLRKIGARNGLHWAGENPVRCWKLDRTKLEEKNPNAS